MDAASGIGSKLASVLPPEAGVSRRWKSIARAATDQPPAAAARSLNRTPSLRWRYYNLEQVARLRISGGAQPPHQALGRAVGGLGQFVESHGSVDVIAQHRLARLHVSSEKAFDAFAQKLPHASCLGVTVLPVNCRNHYTQNPTAGVNR